MAILSESSQYRLLHPIVESFKEANEHGNHISWLADRYYIHEHNQVRYAVTLPTIGRISRHYLVSLCGKVKKLYSRDFVAARSMAIQRFQAKELRSLKEKQQHAKMLTQRAKSVRQLQVKRSNMSTLEKMLDTDMVVASHLENPPISKRLRRAWDEKHPKLRPKKKK